MTALLTGGPLLAFEPYVAEVTVRTVNVRSGPSTNYYIVTSLNAGQRVQVIGEENGWCAIVPPAGCFSLIAETYVDVGENSKGVVNGDAVRVRAGSDRDEHRYAVQTKLDRGAEVSIIGTAVDGFLKIQPPTGVSVWVRGDYVQRVPNHMLNQPAAASGKLPAIDGTTGAPAVAGSAGTGTPSAAGAQPSAGAAREPAIEMLGGDSELERMLSSSGDGTADAASGAGFRAKLQTAEEAMLAELQKPMPERRFDEVRKLYEEIAAQGTDTVSSMFAQRRLAQIDTVLTRRDTLRQMRDLMDQVARDRKDALAGRNSVRPEMRLIERGFEAKGQLRESMIFDSPVGPRRFRLVDPKVATPRTLCYVEIPAESEIDVTRFIGQLVGIRARKQYLETGNVNPIPVVVVDEMVILDDAEVASDGTMIQDVGGMPAMSPSVASESGLAPGGSKIDKQVDGQ
jgi:SH3-like domain-containing protein